MSTDSGIIRPTSNNKRVLSTTDEEMAGNGSQDTDSPIKNGGGLQAAKRMRIVSDDEVTKLPLL